MAVVLGVLDPRTLGVLGQMAVVSFALGREPAMLWAYGLDPTLGPVLILVTIVLDDLLTIALTLPLLWIGLERLRGTRVLGSVVLSIEKTAMEKRAFLARWGIWGLVAFVWFPGVGAGVFLAGAAGLVGRIPLRRLIVSLAVAAVLVDAFWAIGLYYTSALIPNDGIWGFVPLLGAAALILVAAAMGFRRRDRRDLFPLLKVRMLGRRHMERLRAVGITDGRDLVYANRRLLCRALDINPASLGRLRSVAELCLLPTVSPRQAEMLTAVGVTGMRALARTPPAMVASALRELELKHIVPAARPPGRLRRQCEGWRRAARGFLVDARGPAAPSSAHPSGSSRGLLPAAGPAFGGQAAAKPAYVPAHPTMSGWPSLGQAPRPPGTPSQPVKRGARASRATCSLSAMH